MSTAAKAFDVNDDPIFEEPVFTPEARFIQAPGKINLHLAVGEPAENGYHPLVTVFAAVEMWEEIIADVTNEPGITLTMSLVAGSLVADQYLAGAFDPADVALDETNLVYRAAAAVLAEHNLAPEDIALHLHIAKAIPVAGGMAGGSADAAATILLTDNHLYEAGLIDEPTAFERLDAIAASLGADVPFMLRACLDTEHPEYASIAVGTGVGEKLEPIKRHDKADLAFVLVAAPFGLSTPEVFRTLDEGRAQGIYPAAGDMSVPDEVLRALTGKGMNQQVRASILAPHVRNDLQEPALSVRPELRERLNNPLALRGFISGSGPTIVLLAPNSAASMILAMELREAGLFAADTTLL